MHFEQHTELDKPDRHAKPAHLREQGEQRRRPHLPHITRTSMTTFMIAWHRTMHTLLTTSTERRAHSLSSSAHTCTLAQV